MKQHTDLAIVLTRIDYAEHDRILTLLCAEKGRVSVLAKAARSQKSRLAGGIELLSESEVCFIEGRSKLMTLTSARLRVHFGELVKNMRRMQLAFAHIKIINSIVDEAAGQEYYPFLLESLRSLNDPTYDARIVDMWFSLQVLQISGTAPNLRLEAASDATNFEFDHDHQRFQPADTGLFTQNDLKVLRLCMAQQRPPRLQNQLGSEDRLQQLTQTLVKTNLTEL
ncbi:MAG: DNA repair protein RecO [Candidatus Saccharimonadales bacterium]